MFDKARSDQMSGVDAAPAAPPKANMLAINATRIFGANLQRVREALGLSRDDVAPRLGLTEEHLARIEDGIKDQVTFDLIVLATKQLNTSYDDLIEGIS